MKLIRILVACFALTSCKRETVLKEVPVEKITSWTEVKRFTGTERLLLSSGSSNNAMYVQQPFFFSEIRSADINNGITMYGAGLPTDAYLKIPISPSFYAYPYNDTALILKNNKYPVTTPAGGYYNLKDLDPHLTHIQTYFADLFKCMAIDANGVLLLAYQNNRPDNAYTFFLFSVKTSDDYPYVDTVYTEQITIPRTSQGYGYARHLAAVKDYFLIDLSGEGIFKITEDGTFKNVHSTTVVDAFYTWQNKVYAHAEWGKALISSDEGNSFQEFNGIPDFMTISSFYTIRDSLVGASNDNLYTLKWTNNTYTARTLKNDGLEGVTINGIETLRDSVFVATTSGLFVKPVATFFESK